MTTNGTTPVNLTDLLGPDHIAALLTRAERSGHKRTMLTAARIRREVDLLRQLLEQHGEEAAARRKVEQARARLAKAEEELRALHGNGQPVAAANPSATTATMRAWLVENGHPVSDRGRLSDALCEAYYAAHAGGTA